MKLLAGLTPLVIAEWSKCTELCGGGETTQDGVTKSCNREPCSVYDDSLFQNGSMESLDNWSCKGNCDIEVVADAYSGSGIKVGIRTQSFNGPSQTVPAASFTASTYKLKYWVRSDVPNNGEQVLTLTARRVKSDGSQTFRQLGQLTIPAGSTQWNELIGDMSYTWADYESFEIYIESPQPEYAYIVDEAYLADASLLTPPLVGVVRDGDFEDYRFGSTSTTWFTTDGCTLEYIEADDAPSGYAYAKIKDRSFSSSTIAQDLPIDLIQEGDAIACSFWIKVDEGAVTGKSVDQAAFPPWNPHDLSYSRVTLSIDSSNGGASVTCLTGCAVPDGQWDKWDLTCEDIPSGLGTITQIRWSMNGLCDNSNNCVDFYIDDVRLEHYSRDRSWIPAANLRIDDLRKVNFDINLAGRDDVDSVFMKMKKAEFPWGGMIDKYMTEWNEVADINQWFDLFNLGVTRNEHKWETIYKNETPDFSSADLLQDLFEEKNVPLRGHVLYWEVTGKSPDWWLDLPWSTPEEVAIVKEHATSWVTEVMTRYKGRIPNWDTINEIVHGTDLVDRFGQDFWLETIAQARAIDPAAKFAFNDYHMLANNKGKCYMNYVRNNGLDFYGLQSHMKGNLQGQTIINKLNMMSQNDPSQRYWVTEFDVEMEIDIRTEDIKDFIRAAYSHDNVDGLILWSWLREPLRSWKNGDQFNRYLFENPDSDKIDPEVIRDPVIEKPAVCDAYDVVCNYPFGANAAGVEYLKMVKDEWNQTATLTPDEAQAGLLVTKGDYEVVLFDSNGNAIETQPVTITSGCDLLPNEFESDLSAIVSTASAQHRSIGDSAGGSFGVEVYDRAAAWSGPRFSARTELAGQERFIRLSVKLTEATGGEVIRGNVKSSINGVDSDQMKFSVMPENTSEWFILEGSYLVTSDDTQFYISTPNYNGAYIIDRMYDVSLSEWNACRTQSLDLSAPTENTCVNDQTYNEDLSHNGIFSAWDNSNGYEIIKVITGRGNSTTSFDAYGEELFHNEGDKIRIGCKLGYVNGNGKEVMQAECKCDENGACAWEAKTPEWKCISNEEAPVPIWGGAVYNFVKQVHDKYIVLKARVTNGIKLNIWDHDRVNVTAHSDWLDKDWWADQPFTMFVFCPFDTTKGGLDGGDGTMTFPDFYTGECSNDGRLCSFLSRSGTFAYRAGKPETGTAYFKGFIDRSSVPEEQGPVSFTEGSLGDWTCEVGMLPGHNPNAIENMQNHYPAFTGGDFAKMVEYLRPHSDVPKEGDL